MSDYGLFLRPGDTLGLFAPASPAEPREISLATRALEPLGFGVKRPPVRLKPQGYLAGSDQERRQGLHLLMADPEVKALLAIRGGYGSMRLLRDLRPLWPLYPPKPLIGFSDITALHLARLAAVGVGGWHGPCLINLESPGHRKRLTQALRGELPPWKLRKASRLQLGRARGRLLGGNLSLVAALLPTPYWPDCAGAILMLEDQGEDLYRLDRLLTTLRLSGQLEKLAGLVFGDFGPNLATKALRNLLLGLAESCPGPVAWAPYFGHGQENRPWPVGAEAELSLTAAEGYLAFFPSV